MSKKVLILADPNGAGKTTFARAFLPHVAHLLRFFNADLIAAGLSPFAPEVAAVRAGRLMLDEMERAARAGESFAFETTLSGLGYRRHIRRWRADGYRSACSSSGCPTRRWPSRAWRNACARADTTSPRT